MYDRDLSTQLADEAYSVLESFAADWGALIDPTEFLHDDPSFGYAMGPMDLRGDRANGALRPIFTTEAELAIIRYIGRALAESTEHGLVVLETLAAYVVGCGWQWNVEPVEGKETDENAVALAKLVKKRLDALILSESWTCDKEEEFLRRAVRDGEVIAAIMDDPEDRSNVVLRFIEPAQLTEPSPSLQAALCQMYGLELGNWSFGVHTREGDAESVIGYFVQWTDNPNDYTYLPESRVVHWKRNVDANVKRGVSDFFPVREGLPAARKLIRNLSRGASVQAAIAWVQEYADNATPSDVSGNIAARATATRNVPSSLGTRTRNAASLAAGSVIHTNRTKYIPGPLGHAEKASGFIEILAAQLRTLGVRWMVPEFMISGDASNANYASTLAASSPFGRVRSRDQFKAGAQQTKLFTKILRQWCGRECFNAYGITSVDQLLATVSLTYVAPDVQVQDAAEQMTVALQKIELGVPREVVLQELGYTPADLVQAAGGAVGVGSVPAISANGAPAAGNPAISAMSRLQQSRNFSSVFDVLKKVAAGKWTAQQAKVLLRQLALPDADIDELLTDAADGEITATAAPATESAAVRDGILMVAESAFDKRISPESAICQLTGIYGVDEKTAIGIIGGNQSPGGPAKPRSDAKK